MTPKKLDEDVAANCPNPVPVYPTVPPAPKATELESVPVNVRVLETTNTFPSAMVKVAALKGAVMVTLLRVVAVATPSVGVTSVGLVANTASPDPVSSEIIPAKAALFIAAMSVDATLAHVAAYEALNTRMN
jgi:hypothetical protein